MPAMKVLVLGATGALGLPTVRLLRQRDVSVRAACRRPEREPELAALGAETVACDLADPATVARACDGVERVFACAHGLLGRGSQRSDVVDDAGHRALIEAARAAGVRRFVYTSGYGVHADHPVDFFRTKYAIEQALLASGLDAVVLRPTAFMEQHVHEFNGKSVLEGGRARLIGPGTKARNFVCAADVAVFAVRALLEDPPPFRRLDIGGHGNPSNAEVARRYAEAAGVPLKVSRLPPSVVALIGRLVAPLHPGVARLTRLMTLSEAEFPERYEGAAALEREYGVRLTRLEEFIAARVYAAAVNPSRG